MPARPIRARVDLAAIAGNTRLAAELAPGARTVAVVKADAYGHGAVAVARALARSGPPPDAFGVASLEEALALRGAGIAEPILLLAGCFSGAELTEVARQRLDPVIHCREQLELLLAARLDGALRVWLKVDTGMHRLGFAVDEFGDAWRRLHAAPQVSKIVAMTHLARADELDSDATSRQNVRFRRATRGLEAPTSLANSAAVLAWPECHGDWTRPGIMLYGVSPLAAPGSSPGGRAAGGAGPDGGHDAGEARAAGPPIEAAARLRPAMELVSEIIAVRDLAAGEAVGYGGRHVCERPTRLGVVAAGYADGYPRHARDGTPVLVAGHRAPLAGRVSMDLITVDLTELEGVTVGDPVELWGKALPAREVADWCGTIAYELFTGVTARVPREYHG